MLFRMLAASFISTMNVDSPCEMLSDAPTRVNILSTYPMEAEAAGTKHPACARMTIKAVWRRSADLPAMFGPVIMMICCFSLSNSTLLEMYSSPGGSCFSMTGWRPSRMSMTFEVFSSGRTYRLVRAVSAKESSTSVADSTLASACNGRMYASASCRRAL